MILKSISLTNFKCFKNTVTIKLKPITILVGANNSGKSSFLRFFPLLKNSCKKRDLDGVFDWQNEDTDLESFENTVTTGESEMSVEYNFNQIQNIDKESYDFTIQHSLTKEGNKEKIQKLNIISRNINETFTLTTDYTHINCNNYNLSDLDGYIGKNFSFVEPLTRTRTFLPDLQINNRNFYDLCQSERDSDSVGNMRSLFEKATDEFKSFSENIFYIKPLRLDIQRSYTSTNSSELKSDGSNLAEFLKKLSDSDFASLNDWLKECLGDKQYIQVDRDKLYSGEICLKAFKDGEQDNTHNMVDMGFGYSQLLPILVMIWNATKKNDTDRESSVIILIEQPEVHLHPKFQGIFAEILSKATNNNPNIFFIVETHSELIINKLGSLISDECLDTDSVNVLIFNKKDYSTVEEHHYEPEGYLSDWPIDFFDED